MTGSPQTPTIAGRLLAATIAGALIALLPLVAVRAQTEARDIEDACGRAEESDFSDRPEGPFGEAVDCVTWYGIAKGFADGTYGPGQAITRGQMATFLVNALRVAGVALSADPPDAFEDDDGHTHEQNINIAADMGVAQGKTATTFEPNAGVRRDQMASFVVRQIEAAIGQDLDDPADNHFDDDEGNTHEDAINQLADVGIVTGTSAGKYSPERIVTRQQMALFMARDLDFMTEDHNVVLRRIGFGPAVTDGPDLLRVSETSKSVSQVTLEYEFDEDVTNLNADLFAVYAFDGTRTTADSAQVATGNSAAVRVQFSGDKRDAYDLSTVAGVANNAVQSPAPEAIANPEGSAPIQEVTLPAGTTTAPDLVSVDVEKAAGTAEFEFDEDATVIADEFSSADDQYWLVLSDGATLQSDGVSETSDGTDTHEVSFPDLAAATSPVVRAFIEPETVEDADGNANAQQAVVVSSGGATTAPDLVEIRLLPGEDQVEYVFDQRVTLPASNPISGAPGAFRIYYLDGSEADTDDRQVKSGQNAVVVATFDEGAVTGSVAGASVDTDSVEGGAGDEIGLELTFAPGQTAAPKLVSAAVTESAGPLNTTNRSVVYTFDQDVVLEDDEEFVVYAKDGTRTVVPGCSASGNDVTCTANSGSSATAFNAIGNAVLATVVPASVTDANTEVFPNHEGAAVL